MAKTQEVKKETKKQEPEPVPVEKIAIWQYWTRHRSDVHPYLRAYVSVKYDGILKTKREWDREVSKHL